VLSGSGLTAPLLLQTSVKQRDKSGIIGLSREGRRVEVAIWSSVQKPLTYIAPADIPDAELLGRRVVVSVLRSKQLGVITALDTSYEGRLKKIDYFPDLEPVLSARDITVCRFLSEYYYASLGDCIRSYLPGALTAKLRQRISVQSRELLAQKAARGEESAARLLSLLGKRNTALISKAEGLTARDLHEYVEKGAIRIDWDIQQRRRYEAEQLITLVEGQSDSVRVGPRARQVLEHLAAHKSSDLADLRRRLKVSRSTIESLVTKGLVMLTEKPSFWGDISKSLDRDLELTAEQTEAITVVNVSIVKSGFAPFLLYGVTGSGKTEVYLRSIRKALEQGGSAIVIVPEIGLSQAMYIRLRELLGSKIGIVHSRLSDRSRLRIWQDARCGSLQVVLGPRSAVFAPMANLKLIVVDEEHDHSLKQDSPAPRYHARDVALYRGRVEGCAVVLGSATPAVESFYNASTGKYHLLQLRHRVDQRTLPRVRTVDLKAAFHEKREGFLTSEMTEAIEKSLESGGQVMLLLNRRGFSPSVHCHSCGQKFTCRNCAVTLVYHKRANQLVCHSCGYHEPYPEACPSCGSNLFLFRGIGTEKLHEELRARFPEVGVLRMDLDSTRNKGTFREIYDKFHSGEARILVGTQMIAKGFDFPDVALVGIVSADTALELPDFRARERTLQLLTQAAGRAGRLTFPGEVVLQTLHPEDLTIAMASEHDYESFYKAEIAEREALNFPPVSHLILVSVESKELSFAEKMAAWIGSELGRVKQKPYQVLGPATAPLTRRRSFFRYHLLLKTKRVKSTLKYLDHILSQKILQNRRKLSIIVDVDAIDMM
jgi:primosomal protein N' (replication factor Y)